VLCSEAIEIPESQHGATFGGGPLVCAAAIAALEVMCKENLAEQARAKGDYFRRKLGAFELKKVREVRQIGLMIGIELKEKAQPHILKLVEEGILTLPAGQTVLRLLPPLTISYDELDVVVERLAGMLS
jgi:acetylornithine/LysW-gamma-L-lysine aminotransferase